MSSNLFGLFDDQLKKPGDTVAGTPQSLATVSSKTEEQNYVINKLAQLQVSQPKVDYSDFSNFVFFNSALDYFNITGEKILNEYPYDASRDVLDNFVADLDGFQQYTLSVWPKRSGQLRFNTNISSSYITVVDSGKIIGDTSITKTAQVGLLSPNTGSVSVEFWCNLAMPNTASNGAMVILQKASGSGDGYTVYASGSNLTFRMVSGSTTTEVSAPLNLGNVTYYGFVYDRTNSAAPVLTAYTGSSTSFPVSVGFTSSSISGPIYIGTSLFYIGSGSLAGKRTSNISGSIDEVRIWQKPMYPADITGTFNVGLYAQSGLVGLWRFNESGSTNPDDGNNPLVLDSSGYRLNGRITNYWTGLRGSGSLVPFATSDPILFVNAPEIRALVLDKQTSGTLYDRASDNIITRLVPENFLNIENIQNTTVLQNFLYVLARNFDYIKIRIDQFTKVLKTNYGQFDQSPDALLAEVARFFGWEFTGNFLSADAFQYLLGKNVLSNQDANRELDIKLYQIKNEFWKRTLINLMYLYKTKGTRESVEGFLRIYGLNKSFVRLKEYGYKPAVGIQTNRVHAQKSVYALAFSSASVGGFSYGFSFPLGGGVFGSTVLASSGSIISPWFSASALSVEARVLFPTTSSTDNYPIIATGSIWTLYNASTLSASYQVFWQKNNGDPTGVTGSLIFSGNEGMVTLTNQPIFDGKWYNILTRRDTVSGTMNLEIRRLNYDHVDYTVTGSMAVTSNSSTSPYIFALGAGLHGAQMWAQEARVWNKNLTAVEAIDHTLNFQSYGVEDPNDMGKLALQWRLQDNVTANNMGSLPSPAVIDVSTNNLTGSTSGFEETLDPYRKFLFDYNYIASPDFGWNEDKIRTFASADVPRSEAAYDHHTLALEFNMVDALNEDISQAIAVMDSFNNAIGLPANRYRSTYQDIEVLRRKYFARLQGRLNFRVFSDMLEFFDRSFITMVQRLIPARAVFLGDEFVVESHMLERPKHQWAYRRQVRPFIPEGSIKIWNRS